MDNRLRKIIIIIGNILFTIGLVLTIGMVFFGLWPSLVYVLFMALGAILIGSSKYAKWKAIKINIDSIKRLISFTGIVLFVCMIIFTTLYLSTKSYFKEKYTIRDCAEITAVLESYKKEDKPYPRSLDSLIGNNPMRAEWKKDRWNTSYKYYTTNNDSSYTLTSAGKDKIFNSKDDIIYKSN